jgi:hypothetical protein
LGIIASCASPIGLSSVCSDADRVTRFTEQQIDQMSDEQVRQELARNEDLARKGCAVPNK